VSSTRILSPTMTNSARVTYLRHEFLFDQRLNQTPPSALGFGFVSSNDFGQGPPFFNIAGYSPIGGAITGPRNTTQSTVEIQDGATWSWATHLIKMGGEYRHTGIDMRQAIAPNAFFVFAGTFPTNNAVANLMLGAPVVFYQGLGNFERGINVWGLGGYAQDEWRMTPRITLNYGLRYERINPFACCSPATTGCHAALPRASTRSCRVSAWRGIRPAPARGRSAGATASFTISSRTDRVRRRRSRSVPSRRRSSFSTAARG
jgi:outer membrane receptor protein involved in Fe transport